MFLKVSWFAWMLRITFLKLYQSWNILQVSKYFCMIFKSHLNCLKLKNNFTEVFQILECLASFKMFFYNFSWIARRLKITFLNLQSPGTSCKSLQVLKCLASLKVFSNDFQKSPGLPDINIYMLDKHSGASSTSDKCLGPPGTPGVFYKSYKNI